MTEEQEKIEIENLPQSIEEIEKKYNIKIVFSQYGGFNNLRIENGFRVEGFLLKRAILTFITNTATFKAMHYNRSPQSLANEWQAHNVLYKWGIKQEQTKDADLDENEVWYRRFCYWILSNFSDFSN